MKGIPDYVLDYVEKEIVGVYDVDTIDRIIEYLQKRQKQVKRQLEEEYLYDNYIGEELEQRLKQLKESD